jgi:DNA topoisomerase IA
MHALLIAETTPKLMKLASFARATVRDHHWKAVTTGAFTTQIDRFCTQTLQERIKIRHRVQLNRIITHAADADVVYIATDPTPRGDLLAADVADQLLDRYPDRLVKRLRMTQFSADAFSCAFVNSASINGSNAVSMRVSRVINFLVSSRTEQLTGRPSGRAVLPLLGFVSRLERPGMGRIRLRLASGVEFLSGFAPYNDAVRLFDRIRQEVPVFQVIRTRGRKEPPGLYGILGLERDGCRYLGASAIEVATQVEQLYHGGYIGRVEQLPQQYREVAAQEILAFKGAPAPGRDFGPGIVPLNLRCLPSDVPKPVRPVYRLIWAGTLCSLADSMEVTFERARFVADGVEFIAESIIPESPGFDHVSFGLFYRRGCISKIRAVEDARLFGGGPFEHEVLDGLTLPYHNPALVIKAAQNLNYIGFDGPEVAVLEYGRSVLDTISRQVPQLLDPDLFAATEQYLESNQHDPNELLQPWSRWAERVSKAVKKREVAYLR